ncbi:MAG TPA: 30S ribosomal protein S2 [Candidatus Bathyarchaeia archaeon]|nr:30S ribosomal protein S2 [Candidatus Bathyarchaeia archaeon]
MSAEENKEEKSSTPEALDVPDVPVSAEASTEAAADAPTEAEVRVGEELLLPQDTLLSAGIHIGTRMKTKDMATFIYRVRPDGLFVLDVKKTDERIRAASKFLARFEPSRIVAIAARLYAREPVKRFCELTKATPIIGRFIPGMLSNPLYAGRIEPNIVIVSDPKADAQAVKEAGAIGIPVIALCSTDNEFAGVDLVIPTNNKGRRALAVIYWLLTRQILRERGELPPDGNPALTIDDFEVKLTKEE